MPHRLAYFLVVCFVGIAWGQTQPSAVGPPAKEELAVTIEPVILTRASLDEKVVALRLAPRIATSIRMLEPVNSVIVGDPENFQAEHSEREPELVTVKPVTAQAAQTNLLITTTLGHQINLLLLSSGEQDAGAQKVDVLLKYGKPASSASFLVQESAISSSLVVETTQLGSDSRPLGKSAGSSGPTIAQLASMVKPASFESLKTSESSSALVLDKLLDRQRRAPLPALYGQRPGEIEVGKRLRAGVSEVIDEGTAVVVLFSVINPSEHAIELMPPQVQLGGKVRKKWTTAEQLPVSDYRLSTKRLGAGQRADGVAVFERPAFKRASETLFLQMAESGAVDKPALAPIGFGISTFRGGSAYGTGQNGAGE